MFGAGDVRVENREAIKVLIEFWIAKDPGASRRT
jgi:hypothetical protein